MSVVEELISRWRSSKKDSFSRVTRGLINSTRNGLPEIGNRAIGGYKGYANTENWIRSRTHEHNTDQQAQIPNNTEHLFIDAIKAGADQNYTHQRWP